MAGHTDPTRHRRCHQPGRTRICCIEDQKIVILHVLEDSTLGGSVCRHVGVPVEMVGSKVDDHGSARPEAVDETQLERRGFHNQNIVVCDPSAGDRISDVADRGGVDTRFDQHRSSQLRDRGFAVGPGDCRQRNPTKPAIPQLQLAPHRNPRRQNVRHDLRRFRHTGRRHHQIDPAEKAGIPIARVDLVGVYPHRGLRPPVVCDHPLTLLSQQLERRLPADGQANDEDGHPTPPPVMKSP